MERVTIIGLGLIGGSLGLALRGSGEGLEVVGYTRSEETASRARALGAVDRTERNLAAAVAEAGLVVLATPILAMKGILSEMAPSLPRGCTVTDTASTKVQVMEWAASSLPEGVSFIGGHPMAGKEASGIEAADAGLFRGCTYCLVSGPGVSREATDRMTRLVRSLGAAPLFLEAQEHDNLVAAVSHLPLLLSAALVSTTTKSPLWPQMSPLAATGYRDLSRLASGGVEMSRDICLTNKEAILRWIDEYIGELGEYRRLVGEGGVEQAFHRAREARRRWLEGK